MNEMSEAEINKYKERVSEALEGCSLPVAMGICCTVTIIATAGVARDEMEARGLLEITIKQMRENLELIMRGKPII